MSKMGVREGEGEGASALGTNLILHHGVTDILNNPVELIHILCAVYESRDPISLCQRLEFFEDTVQFTIENRTSD